MTFIRSHARSLLLALAVAVAAAAALVLPASLAAGPGMNSRTGSPFTQLTDAQRQCLVDKGLQRPTTRPTAAQRQTWRAATAECDITLPEKGGDRAVAARRFGTLTASQQQCLTDKGLQRPTTRPIQAQREAFRAAASACGIQVPARVGTVK